MRTLRIISKESQEPEATWNFALEDDIVDEQLMTQLQSEEHLTKKKFQAIGKNKVDFFFAATKMHEDRRSGSCT